LDQNDGGIFANDRLELLGSTGAGLDTLVRSNDIFEVDFLETWVGRGGDGYPAKYYVSAAK
jgi:hypothetical protein